MDEQTLNITTWYTAEDIMDWCLEDYAGATVADVLRNGEIFHTADKHYRALVEDIRENGFVAPVSIGLDELSQIFVVNGHHRLFAALELGIMIPAASYRSIMCLKIDTQKWSDGNTTAYHKRENV